MMKNRKITHALVSMMLCLCLSLVLMACLSLQASSATVSEPTVTDNNGNQYINKQRWAGTVDSQLVDNGDGTLTRVEYTGQVVVVETYSSDLKFIKGFTMEPELPLYGGFYYGSDRNYLVFGKNNYAESDSAEVIRVVSYTRDWERIGVASLYGSSVAGPFRAGSLRMAETNGYLYIRTAGERYKSLDDGKNHQTNLFLKLRIADMSRSSSNACISVITGGYVSHSFNQFVSIDGNKVVTVDHGDAYPRSVVLTRYINDKVQETMLNILKISGDTGNNDTGVSVTGLEVTGTHYLVVGNTIDHSLKFGPLSYLGQRNIFVSVTSKNNFSSNGSTLRYLTNYKAEDYVSVTPPYIVDLENGNYLVMWIESGEHLKALKYTLLNSKGLSVDGKVYSSTALTSLSGCEPIVFQGKVIWYVTDRTAPCFFSIDINDLSRVTCSHLYQYQISEYPDYQTPGEVVGQCTFCKGTTTIIMPAVDGSDEYEFAEALRPATCVKNGSEYCTWKKALELGLRNQYYIRTIPALGHDCQIQEIKPTCTESGSRTTTCQRCSEQTVEVLKATGHFLSTDVKNPTCLNSGSRTIRCLWCGDKTVEILPAYGHNFKLVVNTDRYTAKDVCSRCNKTQVLSLEAAGICGDDVTWFLYPSGRLYIFGTGAITEATWEPFHDQIRIVDVDEGVTTICTGAFSGYTELTRVQLPDSLVQIKYNSFNGCSKLSRVILGKGLRSIGTAAFKSCYQLSRIGITDKTGENLLPGTLKEIQQEAFRGCTALTNITVPATTYTIGVHAFANCTALTEVKLNMTKGQIGKWAFARCWRLSTVSMPEVSAVRLCAGAFQDCNRLIQFKIPSGISSLSAVFESSSSYPLKIEFQGTPPKTVEADCLSGRITTAYYPCDEPAWEQEDLQQYGSQVIWVAQHQYSQGSCLRCGKSGSQQPVLTLKAPTLEFKDTVTVNAFYTAENTADVEEMGMITYNAKVSAVDIGTADHVIPGAIYEASSGRYYATSQSIHAKNLGDTVYLAIYAKLTDGTYVYSKLASYSAVQYATYQLENSTDMKLKQLVAAMLNYGAEAQTYFGHNTDALANSGLTEEQKALTKVSLSDTGSTVSPVSEAKQGSFANNGGFASRRPAISFEGAFSINYFFTPNHTPDHGITLYYWNEADFDAADTLTVANATGAVGLEDTGTGEYRGDIAGISARDLSTAVYVAAVYESDGTTWTSGVLGYSIGAYCVSQATKGGEIASLAQSTADYGYHAKAYFG